MGENRGAYRVLVG